MNKEKYPLVNKEIFELVQWILDPKVIDGALRSAIHAHGWIRTGTGPVRVLETNAKGEDIIIEISTCSTSSASKRIRGAVRTRIEEYLAEKQKKAEEAQKELDKQNPRWYSWVVRRVRS